MTPLVEKELDMLVAEGIIELVQFADLLPQYLSRTMSLSQSLVILNSLLFRHLNWIATQFQELKTYLEN